MITYKIDSETKKSIRELLAPAIKVQVAIEKSEDLLTEEEVNSILTYLGRFPASIVYPVIENLKNGISKIDDGK